MAQWSLFSRDSNYTLTGGLRLSSLQAVRRWCGQYDAAVVETPFSEDAYARTAPGCGIVATRDGRTEFSGLVGSERSMGWDAASGEATIKVLVVGDNVHLADRITYPDAARAGNDQTTADYWTYIGPASTAIQLLVSQQLGPAARLERRVPTLYLGTDPVAGANRRWDLLFDPVMDAVALISVLSGANLGVQVLPTADGLRCDVLAPRQLADTIKFSADLSNLTGFTYRETPPEATYVLTAGQGDLHLRARQEATSTDPLDLRWGRRIEKYVDRRDEADAAKLAQYATDALADSKGQVSLACTLTDSEAATYGRDWRLGDQATVYVGLPGQTKVATVVDVIREIKFDVDNDGAETITPAIGTADAKSVFPTPTQQRLAEIGASLADLRRK